MLSVVIPHRNETFLGFTVRRLQETVRVPLEIITVDDGSDQPYEIPRGVRHIRFAKPIGAQFARNTGIEAASFDTVLIIDAHMNFTDDDWAQKLVDYNRANPSHVGCPIMRSLTPERMEMEDARGRYYGAHIIPFDEREDEELHPADRRRILVDKWNKRKGVQQVGCVLGGAYFLSRRWYQERLLSPWAELRGWGYLEANISIPNYLLGGENVCLDIEIGHMFRPQQPFPNNLANVLYNELYLAHVVIPDVAEREALLGRLDLPDDPISREVQCQLDRSVARWYGRYLVENGSRTWEDYKKVWMDPDRIY